MHPWIWLTSGGMWQEVVHGYFRSLTPPPPRNNLGLPALRLKKAELKYSSLDSGVTVQALGWECPGHWVSIWYLYHPDEHRRTEAHPGMPDLFHWPRGFQAGRFLRSASPARQWTAHSAQVGSLPWDCMPCFQNLQRNSAISQSCLIPHLSFMQRALPTKGVMDGLVWFPTLSKLCFQRSLVPYMSRVHPSHVSLYS